MREDELIELKKFTYHLCECYGLDDRIERYKGTRPIALYRWDFECLLMGIELALDDEREYPTKNEQGYHHLRKLFERTKEVFKNTYNIEYK